MSSHYQFYSYDHAKFIELLEAGGSDDTTDRLLKALIDEFEWGENAINELDHLRKAADTVFKEPRKPCEHCGLIYFGIMLLCDHERSFVDGWKSDYSDEIFEFVARSDSPEFAKEICTGFDKGRSPYFEIMNFSGMEEHVVCFIRADEARRMPEIIEKWLEDGLPLNMDAEDVIQEELLPAMQSEVPEGHGIAAFSL